MDSEDYEPTILELAMKMSKVSQSSFVKYIKGLKMPLVANPVIKNKCNSISFTLKHSNKEVGRILEVDNEKRYFIKI